jgi:hypothetical protein
MSFAKKLSTVKIVVTPKLRHAGKMLHAYIDESYSESGFYYVGVLVVDPQAGSLIRTAFDGIARRVAKDHGVPDDAELHGHALFHGRDDWTALKGKPKVAIGVYRAALRAIHESGGHLFFHGLDTVRQRAKYINPYPPHVVALQFALEEVHTFAAKQGRRVRVFADQVPDQEHHEARISGYQKVGSIGYKKSFLESIDFPFEWCDSRQHRNLQAVDMATFICRRSSTHEETSALGKRAMDQCVNEMQPAVRHWRTWTP